MKQYSKKILAPTLVLLNGAWYDSQNVSGQSYKVKIGTFRSPLVLMIVTIILEQDKKPQNVEPDLDPSCLTLTLLGKEYIEKVTLKNVFRRQKS